MDEDPVVDYVVMEAVAAKVGKEERDAQKKAEREQWKKDRETMVRDFG